MPAGLGLDVGGTATRWALADAAGQVLAEGQVGGLTALMLSQEAGRAELHATLAGLGHTLRQAGWASAARAVAGFSGYSEDAATRQRLEALVAQALAMASGQVRVVSDITLSFLDCFAPGEGCLVYAGTGSIALCIEPDGLVHRAGGRGGLLDDGGSGYWMAREALRHVWRAEDEMPGCWRDSMLARHLFAQIGGNNWPQTRDFVYQGTRGQVGELALAVARAAQDHDPVATDILHRAGLELARLAQALTRRLGPRCIALAGRAASLHPFILSAMTGALPGAKPPRLLALHSHATAARLAALDDPILRRLADA
jgi:N-acetylglucosamine kinase-like BadF-type ATPase